MKISVVGAGSFGTAFATAAVAAGHEVSITARSQETAERAAAQSGARAGAGEGADLVVLAIPGNAVAQWAEGQGERLAGVVVADATNPLTADFSDTFTDGRSLAEDVQDRLPGTRVVKAFNTIFASRLGSPIEEGTPLDALLAGDDEGAKAVVADLARSLGFAPLDAGGLRMARALEEAAFLHISLNASKGWVWQSALRLVGPTVPA